jgi:hypothetical protein
LIGAKKEDIELVKTGRRDYLVDYTKLEDITFVAIYLGPTRVTVAQLSNEDKNFNSTQYDL